ncbi:MAG TPA: lipocalin family protein [Candidatus Paceibacterota bacterium]|nr:lipocalin family protein [Candidatus Paceibacterota bacterium]
MKAKMFFLLPILSISFLFTACEKDENVVSSPEELLCKGNWYLQYEESLVSGNTWQKVDFDYPEAVLASYWLYNVDGTVRFYGSIGTISDSYTWELKGDKLEVNMAGYFVNYTVMELTKSTLILKYLPSNRQVYSHKIIDH